MTTVSGSGSAFSDDEDIDPAPTMPPNRPLATLTNPKAPNLGIVVQRFAIRSVEARSRRGSPR